MSSILDSEEAFKKGYKRAGVKTLRNALETMGFTEDDFDISKLTKPEIIEIIENHMGYSRGGAVTKKSVTRKAKGGLVDYRKTGMFK
tara:strand:+ start:65 stop:325 length:261 start_codon:yes stop_codon:yes gene_type:complete